MLAVTHETHEQNRSLEAAANAVSPESIPGPWTLNHSAILGRKKKREADSACEEPELEPEVILGIGII